MPLQNEDIHKQREAYQILQLVAARPELQGHFPILSNYLSFLKDLQHPYRKFVRRALKPYLNLQDLVLRSLIDPHIFPVLSLQCIERNLPEVACYPLYLQKQPRVLSSRIQLNAF